ncbi:MAG: DUF3000 family protein [Actinobacteria bacterium]|nr:DUF3000 family protein [Micrococcales bacterium]MCB0903116.1 DUF3000 family protein [Actinomycetota bacterium]MCO5298790.1 DUF3000 domain-containing protein [Candidatus Nanopelagicales bacterium]MCB9428700.1 DUF3000 family protein [Actinomycetota bacterium]HPE13694.1 DUF3000 family protein [Actinomycetota bacterium]
MDVSEAFEAAVAQVYSLDLRPEIRLSEAPAPSRLAPHAHALTAEIGADQSVGTGRFVLLHDPSAPAAWQADTRLVVYVETDIDSEMAEDQLLTDVGWAWLQECLAAAEVPYAALGGTVTAVRSTSFEALSARGHETSIQIRASWSALGLEALDDHFSVWIALMEMCAGLPPYYPGIARIGEIS